MIVSATIVTINSVKSFLKNLMSSYGRKRMNFYCIAEDKLKLFVLVCFLRFSHSCKSTFAWLSITYFAITFHHGHIYKIDYTYAISHDNSAFRLDDFIRLRQQ